MKCSQCGHEMKIVFNQPLNINGCAQSSTQYVAVPNPTPRVQLCSNFALCGGAAPQLQTFIKL